MSQAIGKSHLLQRDPVVAASKPDKKSINRLKDEHLDSLQRMILQKQTTVSSKQIRSTDIPTEYVALFAFVFIATIGVLVGYQVKKSSSALPFQGKRSLD